MEEEIQLWKIVQERFPKFIKDSNFYEITIDGYSRYGIHPRRFSRDVRLPDPVAIQAINFCFIIDPFIARKIYDEMKTVRCHCCRQLEREPTNPIYRLFRDCHGRVMVYHCDKCSKFIFHTYHGRRKLLDGRRVILPPTKILREELMWKRPYEEQYFTYSVQ